MKSLVSAGAPWLELETIDSTQRFAVAEVRAGRPVGVVFAHAQTAGIGRFGREWWSGAPNEALAMSIALSEYANHPKPYLVGMSVALAAAGAVHTQLQWPNDLVIGAKKVGGVLTELVSAADGRLVPVVGLGINLNQKAFPPELSDRASSLFLEHGGTYRAVDVAHSILDRLARLPEPDSWLSLVEIWDVFDRTPGKRYRTPAGDDAVAIGIGSEGQLLCTVAGEATTVLAADALFG